MRERKQVIAGYTVEVKRELRGGADVYLGRITTPSGVVIFNDTLGTLTMRSAWYAAVSDAKAHACRAFNAAVP